MEDPNRFNNIVVDFDKLTINIELIDRIKKDNLKEISTPLTRNLVVSEITACNVDNYEIMNQSKETTNARLFVVGNVNVSRKVVLGKGGSGVVYLGRSAQDKCTMLAVKATTDKSFKESEVDVMKTMSKKSHANIVQLFEHSFTGTFHYISMDYCNGGDLSCLLQEGRVLPIEEIKFLSRQMADASCYLESMNIIHRDIKLANIFIHHPDEINRKWQNRIYKIGDFGLSKYLPEGELKRKAGTKGYWAPEVLMSKGYTNMADLFSMGVVLFTCHFGKLPFTKKPVEVYLHQARAGLSLPENVHADFGSVLTGLLQFFPGLRMNALEYLNHPFHKDEE